MQAKKEIKELARKVQRVSKKLGYDIKLSHALELISQVGFNQNWHATSAQLEKEEQQIIQESYNKLESHEIINKDYIIKVIEKMLESGALRGKFNLGLSLERNEFLMKDFTKEPNALFVGMKGTGKTTACKFTLSLWMAANADQTQVFIVDLIKRAEGYESFKELDNVFVIKKADEMSRLINLLYEEALVRQTLFKEVNSFSVNDYENKTGRKLSKLVAVMEEFQSIPYNNMDFEKNYKQAGTVAYKYHMLMRIGRPLGVWFIGCSQKSTASGIPMQVVPNFTQKQIFRVSRAEAQYVLGIDEPSKLTNAGSCYTDYGKIDYPNFDESTIKYFINYSKSKFNAENIRMYPDMIQKYIFENNIEMIYQHKSTKDLTKDINANNIKSIIKQMHIRMGHKVENVSVDNGYDIFYKVQWSDKKHSLVMIKNSIVKPKHINQMIKQMLTQGMDSGIIYTTSEDISPNIYRFASENNIEIVDREDIDSLAIRIDNNLTDKKPKI